MLVNICYLPLALSLGNHLLAGKCYVNLSAFLFLIKNKIIYVLLVSHCILLLIYRCRMCVSLCLWRYLMHFKCLFLCVRVLIYSRTCLCAFLFVGMQSASNVSEERCPLLHNQYRPLLLFTVVRQVRLNTRRRELRCIDLSSAASPWTGEIINLSGTDTGSNNRVSLRG